MGDEITPEGSLDVFKRFQLTEEEAKGLEDVYRVNKGQETLTAFLFKNTIAELRKRCGINLSRRGPSEWAPEQLERRVELFYNNNGERYRVNVILVGGWKIYGEATDHGESSKHTWREIDMSLFKRLGPALKEQIPQEWYPVVGSLLDGEQTPAETAKKD